METLAKLKLLGEGAKYDICSTVNGCNAPGICQSFTPDGRCISLLRVLYSNECRYSCSYCPNRVQRDVPRASFTPDELATLFMEFYRRNYVAGLFLSSGVPHSPGATMDEMLTALEILRQKYNYTGYIHLKLIPGASHAQIARAVELAQRVSVNCETPDQVSLSRLSPNKDYPTILGVMDAVKKLTNAEKARQSTQFLVGAAGERDRDILARALSFYDTYLMNRVYFSTFVPVPDTPFAQENRVPLLREHRLYQGDFLLRQYGFGLDELMDETGNLPLDQDPKEAWAIRNPQLFPVEINRASRELLLKVPGIGPRSAWRIINTRRQFAIASVSELKNLGVVVKRAAPFITIRGKAVDSGRPVFSFQQLSLFGGDFKC